MSLSTLFPSNYLNWLQDPPQINSFHNPEEIENVLKRWSEAGAEITTLGQSSQGEEIKAAIIGRGGKTLLAWGYPHPDEPLGSEALIWLGDGLLDNKITLEDWRVVLILCPDPDQVRHQRWLSCPLTAKSFASGCWRPEHLGREIDYGFPLDWGEFDWPRDAVGSPRPDEDGFIEPIEAPFAPLAESIALANAIDRFRPEIVASMHSTHSGGDYTFLLQEEPSQILNGMIGIPEALGLSRHLGEPIDKGEPWLYHSPDLIREPNLAWFSRQIKSYPWFDQSYRYGGNHSAAAYLESVLPHSQFICPESTLFRSEKFSNQERLEESVLLRSSLIELENRGWTEVGKTLFQDKWITVSQRRRDSLSVKKEESRYPMTRGMLGVLAIEQRRSALAEADIIWRDLIAVDDLIEHPYLYERQQIKTPANQVDEGLRRHYLWARDYRQPVTVAQAQSFRGIWPIHTAAMLGGLSGLIEAQDQDRPEIISLRQRLDSLYDNILADLPPEMRQAGEIAPSLQSMVARVLLLTLSGRYSEA